MAITENSSKIQRETVRRTTLNLSVTVEDKQFLKIYAAEHDKTVAAVIHECITEYLSKKESNRRCSYGGQINA